jgi:hypothetical protein
MFLSRGMDRSVDMVKKSFAHRSTHRIPRGELWLGRELFKKAGLEDSLQGHLSLIRRLGHDILCLPLSTTKTMNETLGYRYFSLKELEQASRMDDVFVIAIIDGPFQRLVGQRGLMKVLSGWRRERSTIAQAYEKEQGEVDMLIKRCLALSVDAVGVADDVAGERSLLFDPHDTEDFFRPFYAATVSDIHSAHAYALFHSCGNIRQFIPHLVAYGFDGLAAIQHRANDLFSLKEQYGSRLTFMAGIEAEILEPGEMSLSGVEEYKRLVQSLAPGGGFILCSSSGLYSGDFLQRIQELYRIADAIGSG